jgi:hypothetical protein
MSHTKEDDTPAPTVEQIEGIGHSSQTPEDLKGLPSTAAAHGQGLTGYEHLGVWASIKKFKVAFAICFLAAISAAAEGYQIRFVLHSRFVMPSFDSEPDHLCTAWLGASSPILDL